MADMAEKLGDLLARAFHPVYEGKHRTTLDIADFLIANGVRLEEKQATSDKNGWISVNDELPQSEGLYLVAVKNDHERRYSKTAWFSPNGCWFSRSDVTHWMPLPDPPREVQHGRN